MPDDPSNKLVAASSETKGLAQQPAETAVRTVNMDRLYLSS